MNQSGNDSTQHDSTDTTTVPWWRRGVVYQVYVRSYADANGDGTPISGEILPGEEEYAWAFEYEGEEYRMAVDTRGYRYRLDVPIPVQVTSGRIRGSATEPYAELMKKPGVEYAPEIPAGEVPPAVDPSMPVGDLPLPEPVQPG